MNTFFKNNLFLFLLTTIGCFLLGLVIAHSGASRSVPQSIKPVLENYDATQIAASRIPASSVGFLKTKTSALAIPAQAISHLAQPVIPKHAMAIMEQIDDFGTSVNGRTLRAYVLGNGSNVTIIFGDFHGNERSVPGVVEQLHIYLKQHPDKWPRCRVVLVPYANPDGWAAGTRVNADKVDINRNFPGTWKAVGGAARNNPGPRPASEPETRAIMSLVDKYRPAKIVSIHQPLHMLNWTGKPGLNLAKEMQRCNHYPVSDDVGYATPGAFGDYCGEHKIAIVTLEMPPVSVPTGWQQNRAALLAAINLQQ